MKKYLLLHIGFEQPTPEIMEKWNAWFQSIADKQVDMGGFGKGIEISKNGANDLPWDANCLTGFNIIEAEDIEAAKKIAEGCPFITGIRVYELR